MKAKEPPEVVVAKTPIRMPWWVSVLLAIMSYCSLKYLVPELHLPNPTLEKLSHAAPSFAPLAAIPFLLLAAKQLYDSDIGKKGEGELLDDKEEDPEE